MITKKLNKTSRKMGANYVYRLEELGTVCVAGELRIFQKYGII